jgi:hypothetical protein
VRIEGVLQNPVMVPFAMTVPPAQFARDNRGELTGTGSHERVPGCVRSQSSD